MNEGRRSSDSAIDENPETTRLAQPPQGAGPWPLIEALPKAPPFGRGCLLS